MKMEYNNFNILKAESLIEQAVQNLSVGTAYYILKAKTQELETLYYKQAQAEYAAVQSKAAQDQAKEENDLAPAPNQKEE